MSVPNSLPRSIILFEESIKSKYTKKNYTAHLDQFKKFARINSIDMILSMQGELQGLLEDYIMELRHTTNPNSIPSKFQGIKHFCIMNRISLN